MDDKLEQKKNDFITKIQHLGDEIKKSLSWLNENDGKILVDGISLLIPFVTGSPFGTMLPFLIECADFTVRKRFLREYSDLTNRLDKIKPMANDDFIKSETGQKFLRDLFKQIVEENDKEKLEFQKRFLLNTFIQNEPNIERLCTYHSILTSLEPAQLRILSAIATPKETVKKIMQKRDPSLPDIPIDLKGDVRRLLVIDDAVFERSITRLESENLIMTKTTDPLWSTGKYDKKYYNEAIERMESDLNRIATDFGKDFVKHFKDSNHDH